MQPICVAYVAVPDVYMKGSCIFLQVRAVNDRGVRLRAVLVPLIDDDFKAVRCCPMVYEITVSEEFHRALEVGEEDRDPFALSLTRRFGPQHLLGEVQKGRSGHGTGVAEVRGRNGGQGRD
jgi:hypothetical protein